MRGDYDEGEKNDGQCDSQGENADGFRPPPVPSAQNMKQSDKQIDDNKAQQQNADNFKHSDILPRPAANAKTRRFRPSIALTAAALLAMSTCGALATWQFSRAAQKAALEESARAAMAAAPVALRKESALRPFLRAEAVGDYLPEMQIFVDNRVHNKIAGMHIITPLLLKDGAVVAVNRGFTARGAQIPPPPTGRISVRGILQQDNANAFTLSDKTESGNIWQNLDLQKYAARTNLPLLTLVLFAENVAAPAPVRTDFKSARSTGYALQWLTFAALAMIFYVILGFRKL